jgi:D-alanyl-D-alanine carboxypeptidase
MAWLAFQFHHDHPETWEIFANQGIKFGKKRLRSYNAVLGRIDGADGVKTGFVCASGYNIVASASRGGRRMIAIILGAQSVFGRAESAAQLLESGFGSVVNAPLLPPAPAGLGPEPFSLRSQLCREGGGARSQPSVASVLKKNADKKSDRSTFALSVRTEPPRYLPVSLGGAVGYAGSHVNSRIIIPPIPRDKPVMIAGPLGDIVPLTTEEKLALRQTIIVGVPSPHPGRVEIR